MEFLVTMTTHVPDGTAQAAVEEVRAREAARSGELARKVDPDVLARRRLVTTSQVDTMGAPRPSTRDVAAETGRACSIRRRRTRQDPRFPDAGSTHYASFLERHFGLPEEH